ncbi:Outer membrane protein beta-barrel domain-containing protein [Reichenbachiella faecimaris]|uniref:Outer membrane protein beta-barrel domain-containing protein n=1 Tax=Reichenbachiella faecimaris TaxID=692418 RepID=A0A1W2G7R8_REIFA|nr:outer membrane beta-barrel protein [Reichenbachiella faecimaris]SMD32730.1 Outer membrane protein beta-barrel domain-containing protein [Reichenbachiella faecimaris]
MKKVTICLLLGLGVFLTQEACAQRRTYVGLKGGYNLSSAYFFHSFNGSGIVTGLEGGFQGGIIAMNYVRDHIGLQAELLYTQKGWKQKFDNNQPDFITELDYIELPLLVNLHTGKEQLHIFANAGCFAEFLVNVSQSALPSDTGSQQFYPYDESRDHKFGYGFRGGIGGYYDFDFGTFMLESSFSYSLSDMLDPITLDTGIPNSSKNWVIGFSMAYMFSFGEL